MKRFIVMILAFYVMAFAEVAQEAQPKPGNGVSTFAGGSSVKKGATALILNYHLTLLHSNGDIYNNQLIPVLRVGLGEQWDFFAQIPMQFQLKNGKESGNYGPLGRAIFYFHKQHFTENIEDFLLSVATNYALDMPTNSGMVGKWGFGFGLGISLAYQSHSIVFDILATPYTDKTTRVWAKLGYHYAFNDVIYAGLEADYDYQAWRINGSHNLYLGPIISFKVAYLKNSAWGFGIFGDAIGKYQSKANIDRWRFSSRITMMF